MDRRHLIERAVFDIGFASVGNAREQERSLPGLVQEQLLPVAEEIFDELAPNGVVRIDRLEIDLGRFANERDLQQEAVERFREKLRAVLAEQLAGIENDQGVMTQEAAAKREVLTAFLENGHLKQSPDGAMPGALEALIQELLQGDGEQFADYVRNTPARTVVIKRLSKQFSDAVLARVVQRLGGWSDGERAALEGRIRGLRSRMLRQEAGEVLPGLWERLMQTFAGGSEDAESIIAEAEAMAAAGSGDAMSEEERLAGQLPSAEEEIPLQPDDTSTAQWWAATRALESALDAGDAASLLRFLRAPGAQRMQNARQVFLGRLGGESERERWVERLSAGDLHSLVALLVPAAAEAAEMIMEKVRRDVTDPGTAGGMRRAVWLQLLAVLHPGEAPSFDHRDFLVRLRRALSGFGDEGIAVGAKLEREGAARPERSAGADGEGGPVSRDRLVELEQAVWSRLAGAPGEELVGLFGTLSQADSRFPARFVAQLRERASRLTLDGLSVTELEHLVAFALRGHDEAGGPALHQRITDGERQEWDPRRYYGDILTLLLGDGAGDVLIGGEGGPVSRDRIMELEQAVWSRLTGAPGEELVGLFGTLSQADSRFPAHFVAQLRERASRLTLDGLSVTELEHLVAFALRGHDEAGGPALYQRITEGGRQQREPRRYYEDILAVLLGEGTGGTLIGGDGGPRAVGMAPFAELVLGWNDNAPFPVGDKPASPLSAAEQTAYVDFLRDQNQAARAAFDEESDGLHPASSDPLEGRETQMDTAPGIEPQGETPLSTSPDNWRVRIATALGSGDPVPVTGIWDAALSRHGDLVTEMFHGLSDEQVLWLADHFPMPMLLGLVRLLSSDQMPFIVALAGDPALAEPMSLTDGATGDTGRPRSVWRAVLRHLHSGSGDFDGHRFASLLLTEAMPMGFDSAQVREALARATAQAPEQTGRSVGDKNPTLLPAEVDREQQREWIEQWLLGLHDRTPTAAEGRHRRTQLDRLAAARPEIIERLYARRDSVDSSAQITSSEWPKLVAALVALKGTAVAADLQHHIDTAAARLQDPRNFFRDLCFDLLDGRNIDLESAASEAPYRTGNDETTPPDTLRSRLERLFRDEQYTAIAAEWQELLDQGQGELLASIARPHMADPTMVIRLVSALTGYAVDDLIRRLSPRAGAYFADLLGALQTGDSTSLLSPVDSTEIARLIRRYALTHFSEAEQGFSDDRRRKDLFDYLEQATASWPSSRKVMQGIRTALFRAPAEAAKATENALYGRIVRRLEGGIDDSDMADGIARLARQSPQLMMRLYRQLQSGETEIDVARLSLPEVRQLVVGFLNLGHSGDSSTFLATVEKEAVSARSRGDYYRTILGNLVKNRVVDIEAAKQVDSAPGADEEGGSGRATPNTYATDDPVASAGRDDVPSSAGGKPGNADGVPPPVASDGDGTDPVWGPLFNRLASRLAGAEGDALSAEEFARIPGDRIVALCRLLESGAVPAKVSVLSRDEARLLVAGFVELHRSPSMVGNGFAEAIAAYAEKARDETAYYRNLLERLVANDSVDLEAAALMISPVEGETATTEPSLQATATGSATDSAAPPTAPAVAAPVQESVPEPAPSAFSLEVGGAGDPDKWEAEIHIANAGLVLAAPYLPRLFDVLELTEQGRFRDEGAAERAVHLLQYAVNERCDSPEFLLVLNKLLCGVPRGTPIARRIEASPRERETVDSLLGAIIENWKIIGNTSLQGLRESFLQRAGRLRLKGVEWHLEVETRGIDVLLDQLPWSFSLIKYGWMSGPIHVEWR